MAASPKPNPPQQSSGAGSSTAAYCEVRTESGVYRDWTEVVVQYGIDTRAFRSFRLVVAEPGDRKGNIISNLRLKPGDRVDIALAGKLVVKQGYILSRQAGFDANRHGVQVDGYGKAAPFMDVAVEPGQFKNATYESIARSVLGKHGISFKMGKAPDGADTPFKSVLPFHGETVFAFLSRLARRRGLWLTSPSDGSVIGGTPQGSGQAATIEEGKNIVAGTCMIQMPKVNSVIGHSQDTGSDSLFGKRPSELAAKAQIQGGIEGKRIVLTEGAADQRETQNRVNMEVAAIQASLFRVTITLKGWLKPDGSGLWELGDSVSVKSPTLFPTQGGEMSLKIFSVVYTQSNEGGTRTVLELVNDAVFSLQYPGLNEGSSYSPGATQAQPETPT